MQTSKWIGKGWDWVHLMKLRYELWTCRRFQKKCEQLHFSNLAELEKDYAKKLEEKIDRLKSNAVLSQST